ncbi:hypothetical protein TGME49_233390 [Toxoplasma gondii ME49]|uniref:Uncharacterized protein n=2 Tax=Toxoplasma gondii TaxID=5811 RepID=B6KK25_TOXGV|nr:hypothetical protein TGME49_233390 [Toxoplasma gondii ME49]EPT28770.1 hypothetical protein TGME49_233390 [Toxoplasma gondii ME49]ESS35845.1 hypothetical protein TGVEG_233390 [Toxoplasma gondii VEG]CEL75002.1 TPA: hypothetical protein BN1205_022150 [Toxoplasma gondii VEG]|eukprot:XP_002368198.1 hypothetical protein TGME49_233390 [Toxoplasma gondii ME49]
MERHRRAVNTLEADLIADLENEDDNDLGERLDVHSSVNSSQIEEAAMPYSGGFLSSIGDTRGPRSSFGSLHAAGAGDDGSEKYATSLRVKPRSPTAESMFRTHSCRHLFLLTQTGRSQVKALLASADRGDLLGGALELNAPSPPTPCMETVEDTSASSSEAFERKTAGTLCLPPASDQLTQWSSQRECSASAPGGRTLFVSDYYRTLLTSDGAAGHEAFSSPNLTSGTTALVEPSLREPSDSASGDDRTGSPAGWCGNRVFWETTQTSAEDEERGGETPSDAAVNLDEPFLLLLLLKFLGVPMYGRLCCVSKSLKEACEGRYRRSATAVHLEDSEDPREETQTGGTRYMNSSFHDGTPSSLIPMPERTSGEASRNLPSSAATAFDDSFVSDNGELWLGFLRTHYMGSFNEDLELLEASRRRASGNECTDRAFKAVALRQKVFNTNGTIPQISSLPEDVEFPRKRIHRDEKHAKHELQELQDRIQVDEPQGPDKVGTQQRRQPPTDQEEFVTGIFQSANGSGRDFVSQGVHGSDGNEETERDLKHRRLRERCPNGACASGPLGLDLSSSAWRERSVGSVYIPVQGSLEPSFYRAAKSPAEGNTTWCNAPCGTNVTVTPLTPAAQENPGYEQSQAPLHCGERERSENPREGDDPRHATLGRRNTPDVSRTVGIAVDTAAGSGAAVRGLCGSAVTYISKDTETRPDRSSVNWPDEDEELHRSARSASSTTVLLREVAEHRTRVSESGDEIDPLLLCVSARLSCMILVTSAKIAGKWRELGLVTGWRWFQRNVLRRMTRSQLKQWAVKTHRASTASATAWTKSLSPRVAALAGDSIDLPEGVARSSDHIAWKMTTMNWELLYESVQTEMGYRARMFAEKLFESHQTHIDAIGQIVEDRFDLEQQLLCLPVFCEDSKDTEVTGQVSSSASKESNDAATDKASKSRTHVPRWKRCVPKLRKLSEGSFDLLKALNEAWDEYEEWAEMACDALDCLDFRITQEREACDQRWPHTPNLGEAAKLQFRNFCFFHSRLMLCIAASVYALIHELEHQVAQPSVTVSSNPSASSPEWLQSNHEVPKVVHISGEPSSRTTQGERATRTRVSRAVEQFEAFKQRIEELDVADDGLGSLSTREDFRLFFLTPVKETSSRLSPGSWKFS